MMYHKKLVAAVKVGGKVLRESGDEVILPFGSEYTILIKNLNTVRAMVKVSIDGQDVTGDQWLVISPNSEIELERFIRNGNLQSGNKLKFIERTEQVEAGRGIKAEDGLVRIEWKIEKIQPKITRTIHYDRNYFVPQGCFKSEPVIYGSGSQTMDWQGMNRSVSAMNCSMQASASEITETSVGVTVPGSQSNQQFEQVDWFDTEDQSEVMVLHLKGRQGRAKVTKALTVTAKKVCSTCGKVNNSVAHFCSVCGTSLHLI